MAGESDLALAELEQSVALDATSGTQFLSVVNERTVLRRAADGTVTVFASLAGSLPGSPLGLALDELGLGRS